MGAYRICSGRGAEDKHFRNITLTLPTFVCPKKIAGESTSSRWVLLAGSRIPEHVKPDVISNTVFDRAIYNTTRHKLDTVVQTFARIPYKEERSPGRVLPAFLVVSHGLSGIAAQTSPLHGMLGYDYGHNKLDSHC